MAVVSSCDFLHDGSLHIGDIACFHITLRSLRGTKRHEAYRLNAMTSQIIEYFFLLEARMLLKLAHSRFDAAKRQNSFQLRNSHTGHTDTFCQTHVYQTLQLSPCLHEALNGERFGIRVTGIYVTVRCMIVREWPVQEVHIYVIQLQVF